MSSIFAMGCLTRTTEGLALVNDPHYSDLWDLARGYPADPCWLCGEQWPHSIPTSEQIGEGFTNHAIAQAPTSSRLCTPCAFFLMAHPASRHWWRNRSSLFVYDVRGGGQVLHPRRSEWAAILLAPPEPPYMACLAVSGQKNLIFRAPISFSRSRAIVQLEEDVVLVRPPALAALLQPFEELLAAGLTRDEVVTGRANSAKVLRMGPTRWRELDEAIALHRGSMLLRLVAWVARRPEKERTDA